MSAINVTSLRELADDYLEAKRRLTEAVALVLPVGSWAKVNKPLPFVGQVHLHCADPVNTGLVLEHGDVRYFQMLELTPTEKPWWAKPEAK